MVDVAIKSTDGHPLVYASHHDYYSDATLRNILSTVRSFAMVGASPNIVRPSYFAMKYLIDKGFRVIPVNPGHASKELLGENRMVLLEITIDKMMTWKDDGA